MFTGSLVVCRSLSDYMYLYRIITRVGSINDGDRTVVIHRNVLSVPAVLSQKLRQIDGDKTKNRSTRAIIVNLTRLNQSCIP